MDKKFIICLICIIATVAAMCVIGTWVTCYLNNQENSKEQWELMLYLDNPRYEITTSEYELLDVYVESHPIRVVKMSDSIYDPEATTYGTYLVSVPKDYITPKVTAKLPFELPMSSIFSFSEELFGVVQYEEFHIYRKHLLEENTTELNFLKNWRITMNSSATSDTFIEYLVDDTDFTDVFNIKGQSIYYQLVLTSETYYKLLKENIVVNH